MDFSCLYFYANRFISRMAYNLDGDEWNGSCCDLCFETDRLNIKAASYCDNCFQFKMIRFMKGLTLPEDMWLKEEHLC